MLIGDIIGKPGRLGGDAAASGPARRARPRRGHRQRRERGRRRGVTPELAEELLDAGVDVITSGNHIWDKREIYDYLDSGRPVLRPLNYPDDGARPRLAATSPSGGGQVAVINAHGPRLHEPARLAVRGSTSLLDGPPSRPALGDRRLPRRGHQREGGDGLVPRRAGERRPRHPHPRADRRRAAAAQGTAYITDVGMTGPRDSIIGFSPRDGAAALPDPACRPASPWPTGRCPSTPVVVEAERGSGRATDHPAAAADRGLGRRRR